MSTYIHKGSFRNPVGARRYEDGRHICDRALKAMFAAGPQRPDSLVKRDRSDAALNAAMAKKLSRQERLRRSNAAEALEAVRKVHGKGPRRSLDEAQGDEPFISKSVTAMRKARTHAVHAGDHRMLSARELNKAFSKPVHRAPADIDLELRKRDPAAVWRSMSPEEKHAASVRTGKIPSTRWNAMTGVEQLRELTKGLTSARPRLNDTGVTDNYNHGAPESLNSQWNSVHADTGAVNNWRDIPVPSVRPTIVGSQNTATPSMLTRDAAVDAIKFALRKPQKLFGNTEDTEDLDEDDEDLDDDDDQAKNPNRDDARR